MGFPAGSSPLSPSGLLTKQHIRAVDLSVVRHETPGGELTAGRRGTCSPFPNLTSQTLLAAGDGLQGTEFSLLLGSSAPQAPDGAGLPQELSCWVQWCPLEPGDSFGSFVKLGGLAA
jgi:hypothetical protein